MNAFSMMMFNVAQKIVGMRFLLGEQQKQDQNYDDGLTQVERIVKPIDELFDLLIVPLLTLIGAAGMIYSIVLGVQYSKAESSDKREEAKKRLVNTIIGFVVVLVLLIVLRIFTNNIGIIKEWVTDTVAEANDPNKQPKQ